jgi:hypothetical protein
MGVKGRGKMKLTYWVAPRLQGQATDAIIARTKHDCEQKVLALGTAGDYAAPVKKSFLYGDAFDLFEMATAEDGGRGMG